MNKLIACAAMGLFAGLAHADCGVGQFVFSDFSSSAGLTLVGDADVLDNQLRLTRVGLGGQGAAWYTTAAADLSRGFTTTFEFTIQNGTADGFAFVIQNWASDAIGSGGSGLGYETIPASVAVEFDTYGFEGEFEIPHVSVQSNGLAPNDYQDGSSLGHVVLPFGIDDGNVHSVKVEYTPGVLYVWVDGEPRLFVPLDLTSVLGTDNILGEGGCAWVGLTGGAGGATADQLIQNWSFTDYPVEDPCVNLGLADPDVTFGTPETGDRVYVQWYTTGSGPYFKKWRIHDGDFFVEDARHLGVFTNRMIIDPWIPADNVAYDFEASNACGGLGVGSFVPGIQCPGDLNYDGIVEDADFVIFVEAYNALVVPDADKRCDWNGDRLVEDSDFVMFAAYYNDLLCP